MAGLRVRCTTAVHSAYMHSSGGSLERTKQGLPRACVANKGRWVSIVPPEGRLWEHAGGTRDDLGGGAGYMPLVLLHLYALKYGRQGGRMALALKANREGCLVSSVIV